MAWGLFPLFFAAAHMGLEQIAVLAAIYPATWGIAQIFTGALSDRLGRKWLIASGMWVQAIGIAVIVLAGGFAGFALGCALRLWRDLGYAIGAVLAGLIADALGLAAAMWLVAGLTLLSGIQVALRLQETHRT